MFQKLFQSSRLFFLLTSLHILAFEFAAYFVLFRFGTNWLSYLFTLLFYVIAEVCFFIVCIEFYFLVFFLCRLNVVGFNMILVIYLSLEKLHGIIHSIVFFLVQLKFVRKGFYSIIINIFFREQVPIGGIICIFNIIQNRMLSIKIQIHVQNHYFYQVVQFQFEQVFFLSFLLTSFSILYRKLKAMQNMERKCPIIFNIYIFLSVKKQLLIYLKKIYF